MGFLGDFHSDLVLCSHFLASVISFSVKLCLESHSKILILYNAKCDDFVTSKPYEDANFVGYRFTQSCLLGLEKQLKNIDTKKNRHQTYK